MPVLTCFELCAFSAFCGCYRNVMVYFTALLMSNVIEEGSNVFKSLGVLIFVSTAILKLVYRVEIPSSDAKLTKR